MLSMKKRFIQKKKKGGSEKTLCLERQQFYLSETNKGDSISKDNKGLIKTTIHGIRFLLCHKGGHVGTRGELHHFSLIASSPTRRRDMGKMLSSPVVPEVWSQDQRDSTPWEIF